MSPRIERDALGEKELPDKAYYGVQTQRAVENFPISGRTAHPALIVATVQIKKAVAKVHVALGLLTPEKGSAIIQAADEILAGKLHDQFVVDVFQAGAGTSHNMNTNEVIANRAIEILGGRKGDYFIVHPNDDINKSQSTNDVMPTAMRLASLALLAELLQVLAALKEALGKKSNEFHRILKSGRTHLQDATPIRLGQEFSGYARCIEKHIESLQAVRPQLEELGIGGSAVGTGLNVHPEYRTQIVEALKVETGFPLRCAENYFEPMQSMAPFTGLSGALRNLAVDLCRIANDLRLLSSGPRVGLAEIQLPAVQPGSSMMPGKVNPVMAEMLNMVCFQVIGNDSAIAYAAQAGQLELNVMMPGIAAALLESLTILRNAVHAFNERCVKGIQASEAQCRAYAERSIAIVTALSPHIGYAQSAEVAKQALATGKTIREVVLEKGLMPEAQLDRILRVDAMTEPGIPGDNG
jgi:aspartate ammonia-lyase